MNEVELYKLISKIYDAFELLTDSTYLDLLSNSRYDRIYKTWEELEKLKNKLEKQISENDCKEIIMLKVARLDNSAFIPYRKYRLDAGIDLHSLEDVTIEPFEVKVVRTGIAVELPKSTMGWITNKSSSNYLVGAGVVDEGYTGELLVKIFNPTNKTINIPSGKAIAQLVILPIVRPIILLVDHIEETSERKRDGGISRNE